MRLLYQSFGNAVCRQSTTDFPSWTSRVRSRSPAFSFEQLSLGLNISVLRNTPLSGLDCDFELVDRSAAMAKIRNGVDVLIYIQRMSQLIGHKLRIDLQLVHERRMCPPHHLKIHPAETDRV